MRSLSLMRKSPLFIGAEKLPIVPYNGFEVIRCQRSSRYREDSEGA
jgi:hypothetical protein